MSRDELGLEFESRILDSHDCTDHLQQIIHGIFECGYCFKRFMVFDNGSYEEII